MNLLYNLFFIVSLLLIFMSPVSAQSIIGEVEPLLKETKKEVKKETVKEVKKEENKETVDYSKMTVPELKKLAKEKGVSGYSTMKKDELISSLN